MDGLAGKSWLEILGMRPGENPGEAWKISADLDKNYVLFYIDLEPSWSLEGAFWSLEGAFWSLNGIGGPGLFGRA